MESSKLNKKLLRKVIKAIEAEPLAYDQGTYFTKVHLQTGMPQADVDVPVGECGTACCVAGRIVLESGGRLRGERSAGTHDRARMLLGLTQAQAFILFDGRPQHCWPSPYAQRWEKVENVKYTSEITYAKLRRRQAEIAVSLLNKVLKYGPEVLTA